LIVDQLSYYLEAPERGDVVVFRYPKDPSKYFIKRVIGVPGDTLTIEGNVITVVNQSHIEGAILSEPYVDQMSDNTNLTEVLGEKEYFVMGDNRDFSSDSRSWGILTEDKIIGRALVRLFPIQNLSLWPGKYDGETLLVE
jgi:signal peptidase I